MPTVNINLGLTAVAGGGAVDVITATYSPAVTALTDRLVLIFRASGANTSTTPNFSPNGLTARTLVKNGGQALVAGDIPAAGFQAIVMYDLANTRWELLNPFYGGDSFWKAGAGTNSLMDKRSTTGSGNNGFTAGNLAVNTGLDSQAIGAASSNTAATGQAIGGNAQNSGNSGQAIGQSAINESAAGQAIGDSANNIGVGGQAIGAGAFNSSTEGQAIGEGAVNSGDEGQAIGHHAQNDFARSTALGEDSVTTAIDQTNISKTLRFQAYTGGGDNKVVKVDTNGIITTGVAVQTVASAATVTAVAANDLVVITAQAEALTLANPTGTWEQGQALVIRIKDNGTSRTIAYGAKFRALGTTLPTATTISKTVYLFVIYNSTDDTFDVTGVSEQA